jgi:hypothetical protein
VNGQRHAPAALIPISIEYEAGRIPEPTWKCRRREKFVLEETANRIRLVLKMCLVSVDFPVVFRVDDDDDDVPDRCNACAVITDRRREHKKSIAYFNEHFVRNLFVLRQTEFLHELSWR